MRINKTDRFWVVTDASPVSELGDILFETDLGGLERQFKGGLRVIKRIVSESTSYIYGKALSEHLKDLVFSFNQVWQRLAPALGMQLFNQHLDCHV